MTTRTLPSPVSVYVEAMDSFDLDGLAAVFDGDAVVNDHRDEFIGKEQIRAWAARVNNETASQGGDNARLYVLRLPQRL